MSTSDVPPPAAVRLAIEPDLETLATGSLAARELRDYLRRVTGSAVVIVPPPAGSEEVIRLRVDASIGADSAAAVADDSDRDDAIAISVHGSSGTITGRNPRSLLIGVYRYLRELGCRWLRPGPDGEHVPALGPTGFAASSVDVTERASLRHRGICIEGSTGLSDVLDLVDWLPKAGMNAYFVQFLDGAPFFRQWYTGPNAGSDAEYSADAAAGGRQRVVDAVRERGLDFHAIGHGWTTAAIGLESSGWDTIELGETEPRAPLAEVDGTRDLWRGVPANTELCYSDPRARDRFTQVVVEYAQAHPEVDLLHIWLSDGNGNHCECENCRVKLPADWYVMLLNQIDAELTDQNLHVRLVALAYHQLLWAPREGAIANPERVVFMFAPITRDYRAPLPAEPTTEPMPPYPGNEHVRIDLPVLLSSLRDWRAFYNGDSFVYDYHFMWSYVFDPGMTRLARIIADDVRHYRGLGLNGLISCQSQRIALPDGMAQALYAQVLWDVDTDVDAWVDDHYSHEYGDAAPGVVAYLRRLSEHAEHVSPFRWHDRAISSGAEMLGPIREELESFLEAGEPRGLRVGVWPALEFHAQLWLRQVAALEKVAAREDVEPALADYEAFALAAPAQVQSQFDAINVTRTFCRVARNIASGITETP